MESGSVIIQKALFYYSIFIRLPHLLGVTEISVLTRILLFAKYIKSADTDFQKTTYLTAVHCFTVCDRSSTNMMLEIFLKFTNTKINCRNMLEINFLFMQRSIYQFTRMVLRVAVVTLWSEKSFKSRDEPFKLAYWEERDTVSQWNDFI